MSRSRSYDALSAFQSEALSVELCGLTLQRRQQASEAARKQGLKRTEAWKYTFWHKYWPRKVVWQDAKSSSIDFSNLVDSSHQSKIVDAEREAADSYQLDIDTLNHFVSATGSDQDTDRAYQTQLNTLSTSMHQRRSVNAYLQNHNPVLEAGLSIYSLSKPEEIPVAIKQKINQSLAQIASEDTQTLTALNTARTPDISCIHVAANSVCQQTLYLQHIHALDHSSTQEDQNSQVIYPRVLLIVEEGAQVSLIEDFTNQNDGLCNHVIEIHAADTKKHF